MKLILTILAMVIATQFTRAFPFLLFSRKEPPKWLTNSARFIPGAVMMTLVLTTLPLNNDDGNNYYPWIAAASVVLLHLTIKHPLISIFGGTAVYMILLNFF